MSRSQSPTMTLDGNTISAEDPTSKQPANPTNSDHKSGISSPQPTIKSSTKIKDLERLLAKCKESLKLKNSQIKTLKDSLGEVEKFKDFNEELKRELADLREAHETWTVMIAENKRVLHQEIENKNAEMEALKSEINDLQARLNDSHNKSRQLKSAIQDLESRLVSTSAAHQKERENLTKEMTLSKNAAIKQLQKDHELQVERIKVDLEKSIEALKQDLLRRDEQIIKDTELQQQLQAQNGTLTNDLDVTKQKLTEHLTILEQVRGEHESTLKRLEIAESEISSLQTSSGSKYNELEAENQSLGEELSHLRTKLDQIEASKLELHDKIRELESTDNNECQLCEQLHKQVSKNAEEHEQSLYELNTKLDLMTTANADQEREIKSLKKERDCINESYKCLKTDFEELSKRNDSLARIIKENEADMQSQLEQIELLSSIKQELENFKKENLALNVNFNQVKAELNDRNSDLNLTKEECDKLRESLSRLEAQLADSYRIAEELKREKESLAAANKNHNQRRRELDGQLVVRILAAMKNLETPNNSPGSDKTYDVEQTSSYSSEDSASLPDLLTLSDKLSSLALDRSSAYMTTTQRLQAVLLENTMMGEDLRRLREELNNLNHEKTLETQCSLDEAERLKTENQALIHDQKSYDDRVATLETDINELNAKLAEKTYQTDAIQKVLEQFQEENQRLKDSQKNLAAQMEKESDKNLVPDSTQFEYLKNIIYQFMLGKEPLVLARVISAVLGFDPEQIEQICRVQEAIQSISKPIN